jgi:hypothetical protein
MVEKGYLMTRSAARMHTIWETSLLPELRSRQLLLAITLGFAGIAFLVSELMHYLLVPDLGRHAERMVAEAVTALIVGFLATELLNGALQRHRATIARLQVIREMNHHIRNALCGISLSTSSIQDQQSIRVISEGVEQIDWALREILPRYSLVSEEERKHLLYVQWRRRRS